MRTREDFARLADKNILRAAIAASPDKRPGHEGEPMPATEFATEVALCDPRTLRRYLKGDRYLPPLLREKCLDIAVAGAREAVASTRTA
jgi:hypothetical protein